MRLSRPSPSRRRLRRERGPTALARIVSFCALLRTRIVSLCADLSFAWDVVIKRTLLGILLQMFQQLTGANYFCSSFSLPLLPNVTLTLFTSYLHYPVCFTSPPFLSTPLYASSFLPNSLLYVLPPRFPFVHSLVPDSLPCLPSSDGASIFQGVGISDSYVTQIILGAVNVGEHAFQSSSLVGSVTLTPSSLLKSPHSPAYGGSKPTVDDDLSSMEVCGKPDGSSSTPLLGSFEFFHSLDASSFR